jgi:hypothetical protein
MALKVGEWSASCLLFYNPGKQLPVTNVQVADWASELVWTVWRREKSLTSAGN